jgi:hypothetical protein
MTPFPSGDDRIDVSQIKSDGTLETSRHPFSIRVWSTVTMSHSTRFPTYNQRLPLLGVLP